MCEKCFVQTKNYSYRRLLPFMEKHFIFNRAILKIFVNFAQKMVVGKTEKSRDSCMGWNEDELRIN